MKAKIFAMALAAAVVGIASAAPEPAVADESKKTKREADRHFKTGVKLFDEEKYSEALAEFEQAYALKPHPLVLYNLATAHRALSQYDQAVDFYNRFLSEGADAVDKKRLKRAKKELKQLLALVARLTVTTAPDGATVSIDGREIGTSPLDEALVVGPGDHVVSAALEGHQPAERTLRVASGDALDVALTLAETPEETDTATKAPAADVAEGSVLDSKSDSLRRIGVSAAYASNTLEIGETGAPVIGVGFAINDRISVGVDAVLVAYSVIPEVRVRLFGDAVSVHVIAAAPVSFKDGDMSETFVAGAGGLGARLRATPMLSFRAEAWVSYAGSERGTTLPVFAAAELWF